VTLTQLADLSIVILGVEAFFLGIVLAAFLVLAIAGTSKTIDRVRIYGPRARAAARKMAASAEQTSQRIASPFVSVSASRARVKGTVSAAFTAFSHRKGD
jgi:hypothetical protein